MGGGRDRKCGVGQGQVVEAVECPLRSHQRDDLEPPHTHEVKAYPLSVQCKMLKHGIRELIE